jgi:hypothetical protein
MERDMTFRAKIDTDWSFGGLAITLADINERMSWIYGTDETGRVIRKTQHTHAGYAPAEPTLRIGEEEARVLLDALLDHFRGGSDERNARDDLKHERARVDKLMDSVIRLAERTA